MINKTDEEKWINNPYEILDISKILNIIPDDYDKNTLSQNKSFNEISRFIILVGIFSYIRCDDKNILIYTLIAISIFIMLHSQIQISTSNNVLITKDISEDNEIDNMININNPFNNRTPYTKCSGNIDDIIPTNNIGLQNKNIILRPKNPSKDEIMRFQKSLLNENEYYSSIEHLSQEAKFMQEQKVNGVFRQFMSLSGNDCIDNQQQFAEILYGNPQDLIYKQKNLENFAMK